MNAKKENHKKNKDTKNATASSTTMSDGASGGGVVSGGGGVTGGFGTLGGDGKPLFLALCFVCFVFCSLSVTSVFLACLSHFLCLCFFYDSLFLHSFSNAMLQSCLFSSMCVFVLSFFCCITSVCLPPYSCSSAAVQPCWRAWHCTPYLPRLHTHRRKQA